MKCNKLECGLKGTIVFCLDYPKYPYEKCPYYKMKEEKHIGAMTELRREQLNSKEKLNF